MPGAGKSTVANLLREKNFHVINMGDIIREKVFEKGLELNDKNLGDIMKKLREEHGNEIVAKLTLQKIKKSLKNIPLIVIDGIRSYEEFTIFKDLDFVKLLAIHASSNTRYDHIKSRDRSDVPPDYEKFSQRDEREILVGISKAIALADDAISNNNLTMDELRVAVNNILQKWTDEFEKFKEKDVLTI